MCDGGRFALLVHVTCWTPAFGQSVEACWFGEVLGRWPRRFRLDFDWLF